MHGWQQHDRQQESGGEYQSDEKENNVENTGVDALAVSVGNIHLATTASNELDITLLKQIENLVPCPLVLHGGSGIVEEIPPTLLQITGTPSIRHSLFEIP